MSSWQPGLRVKLIASLVGVGLAALAIYLTFRFIGRVLNIDAMSTQMRIAVYCVMLLLLVGTVAILLWMVSTLSDMVTLSRAKKDIESGDLAGAWKRLHFLAGSAAGISDRTVQRCVDGFRDIYSRTGQEVAALDEIAAVHRQVGDVKKAAGTDEYGQPGEDACEEMDRLVEQCRELINDLPRPTE